MEACIEVLKRALLTCRVDSHQIVHAGRETIRDTPRRNSVNQLDVQLLSESLENAYELLRKQQAHLMATMIAVSSLLHRAKADPTLEEELRLAIDCALGIQLNAPKISDQTISHFLEGMRAVLPASMSHLVD
jgi:hypothetical protein